MIVLGLILLLIGLLVGPSILTTIGIILVLVVVRMDGPTSRPMSSRIKPRTII